MFEIVYRGEDLLACVHVCVSFGDLDRLINFNLLYLLWQCFIRLEDIQRRFTGIFDAFVQNLSDGPQHCLHKMRLLVTYLFE